MLFEEEENKTVEKEPVSSKSISIIPLKDFRIVQNDVDITFKEGVEIEVDKVFIPNLKAEKVIE